MYVYKIFLRNLNSDPCPPHPTSTLYLWSNHHTESAQWHIKLIKTQFLVQLHGNLRVEKKKKKVVDPYLYHLKLVTWQIVAKIR